MSNVGKRAAALARQNAALAQRNADGSVSLKITAESLGRPQNVVVANWASVERLGDEFEIVFGQLVRKERRLTAALYVAIPAPSMAELLGAENVGGDGPFADVLERYAKNHNMHDYVPDAGVTMPAERNAFERASVGFLAQAGDEAEARFFHVSPGDALGSRPVHELRGLVKPVVTVMMNTSVLWYVCRTCRGLLK